MKPHLKSFGLAVLLAGLPLLTGCGGEDSAKAQAVPTVTGAASEATNAAIASQPVDNSSAQTNAILAAVPPKVPDDVKLSMAVDKVIKMAQSGVGDSVLLAYVQHSGEPFNLDADEILYLTDIGLSEEVLTAMLNHDGASKDLINQAKDQAPATAAMPPTNGPGPVGVSSTPINPNVAVQEVPQQPPQVYAEPPVVDETQPVVTYDTFYTSLAPYGTWVDVPAYGWCWEPTVAIIDTGWRPYSHRGRWLYSDCGWYWQSDYSWGWAPFHYGRWYRPEGRGWCWVPDRVWGPSWVSWRQGSGYCGWAPLPPAAHFRPGFGFSFHDSHVGVGFGFGLGFDAFTFVPTARFLDRAPYRHEIPRTQATTVYNHTTVINNYVTGNNNTVINHGIDPSHVAAATHTEIRKVAVRDIPAGASLTAVHPEKLRKQGNDLVIYRPSPTVVTHPSSLRPQTSEHITVNHSSTPGSESVNPAVRNEIARSRPVIPTAPSLGSSGIVSQNQPSRSGAEPVRPNVVPQNSGTASRNLATAAETRRPIGSITDQSGSSRIVSRQSIDNTPQFNRSPQNSRESATSTANNPPAASPSFRPQVSRAPETTTTVTRQESPRYVAPVQQPQVQAQRLPEPVRVVPQPQVPVNNAPNIETRSYNPPPQHYVAPNPAPPVHTPVMQQPGYSRGQPPVTQQPSVSRAPQQAQPTAQPSNHPAQGRGRQNQ